MADDHDKLSKQLVMTPQLQMAIKLLGTPTKELGSIIDPVVASYGAGLVPLRPDERDPMIDIMAAAYAEEDQEPWEPRDESPFAPKTDGVYVPIALGPNIDDHADVWIFGDPPVARANGRAFPRFRVTEGAAHDAKWLVRALWQRAKTYERIVGAVLAMRPELAHGGGFEQLYKRDLAEALEMHESTISRTLLACRIRNAKGIWGFVSDTVNFLQVRPLA
jgi:sigma-54-like protein